MLKDYPEKPAPAPLPQTTEDWLPVILEEMREQTKLIRSINRVINILGFLMILAFLLGSCSILF